MPDDKINVMITPIEKKDIIIEPDYIIYVIVQQDVKPQYEIISVIIHSYNFKRQW